MRVFAAIHYTADLLTDGQFMIFFSFFQQSLMLTDGKGA